MEKSVLEKWDLQKEVITSFDENIILVNILNIGNILLKKNPFFIKEMLASTEHRTIFQFYFVITS